MTLTNTIKTIGLALILMLSTQSGYSTDGYFSHGYGIRYKAMAGSGISLYYSTLGAANNPAGLVYIGKRFDAGLAVFVPMREFDVTGNPSGLPGTFGLAPGTVESDNNIFIIPSFGANFMINDQSSFGFAIYGNGGMNTKYPTKVFGGTSETTGVNLAQMFFNASYSRKISEKHSIGISGILAYQMFEANGLDAFSTFSMEPTKLTDNGTDNSVGFGFKIGYMGEIATGLRLGASYQSKMFMSEFEDYSGLFAEGGSFDIPSNWTAGISYQFTPDWLVSFDVQQIMYGEIESISNIMDPMALLPAFPDGSGGFIPNPNYTPLGDKNASGFGWEDMTVYKAGVEFRGINSWIFRAGYSYGNQPIPDSEMMFNILAPGVIEQHVTFGFSKALSERNEFSFALMHGFSNTINGPNYFEAVQQTIELKMHQWEFEIGFSF